VGTLVAIRPELDEAVRGLYGTDDVAIELSSSPKEPFMVTVKSGASPSVEELLGRLSAAKG
jgi:hypothetical protein